MKKIVAPNSIMWISVMIKNLVTKKRKLFSEMNLNYLSFKFPFLRKKRNNNRDYKYFDQAMSRIMKRIDLIRYVKNYQITKSLSRLVLNEEQNFYMKNIFQKVIKIPLENNEKIKKALRLYYLRNIPRFSNEVGDIITSN